MIRWSALAYKIPLITTMAGAAMTAALRSLQSETMDEML
ncbi:hypothetical protein AM1_5411 [Acaryochloris marina MBIC11017]|uniref:Uncharacterized protein n=1 Tax=Acaryochloris marina (strain MBIC 11017) TaxID=329726 RepID=B0CBW7_ACAM1|nr:hypothetical protein AM1_5411 [Acaryochloris marina MBIC11017]